MKIKKIRMTTLEKVEQFHGKHIWFDNAPMVFQWSDTVFSVIAIKGEPTNHPDTEINDIYNICIVNNNPVIVSYECVSSSDFEEWSNAMRREYSPEYAAERRKADIDLPF